MQKTFTRCGEIFDRVTIVFAGGRTAPQARAVVQDALARAHGFRTFRWLTDNLAVAGGRFRVAIARRVVKALKRRLHFLIAAGLVRLFVAGRRVPVGA